MKEFNFPSDVLRAQVHVDRMIEHDRPHLEHAGEESGHAPELILAPVFVRMIVALCAIETAAEEYPDFFRHHVGRRTDLIVREEMP